MILNNSVSNLSTNKNRMSALDSQLSTYKKISRPSDDPIIAIRALRLRSSLTEVSQYLEKNIPDATEWMSVSEGALVQVDDMFRDVLDYCTQGSTDSLGPSDRRTIINSLSQLKDAIFDQGNVDYAGRYVFTGYKTDSPLTFTTEEEASQKTYTITENINPDYIDKKTITSDKVDISNVGYISNADMPSSSTVRVYKLAYEKLDNTSEGEVAIKYNYDEDGNAANVVAVTTMNSTDADAYIVSDDEVRFLADTGEIVMGNNVYDDVKFAGDMTFEYDKTGFEKGEIKPEHYFTCIDKTGAEPIEYVKEMHGQDINYNVSYSQKIKVNTEASDALSYRIGSDIDALVNNISEIEAIEEKASKLKKMLQEDQYSDDASQKNLNSMLDGVNKELAIANNNIRELFDATITKFQDHQQKLDFAISDIGTRGVRLELTKNRLLEQQTNIKDLKSENEDIDLEETAIDYSSSNLIYNASLQSASKVVRQSLLDFLT